jgi:hypothetical protein
MLDVKTLECQNVKVRERLHELYNAYQLLHFNPIAIALGPIEYLSFQYNECYVRELRFYDLPIFLQERAGITMLFEGKEAAHFQYRKEQAEIGGVR